VGRRNRNELKEERKGISDKMMKRMEIKIEK
jgi:hypothetical protein